MNLRVTVVGEVKGHETRSRSESESEQGEFPLRGKHIYASFPLGESAFMRTVSGSRRETE